MKRKPIMGSADHRPRIWLEIVEQHDPVMGKRQGVSWRIGHAGRATVSTNAGEALNDALTHIGMVPAVIMWLKQEVASYVEAD